MVRKNRLKLVAWINRLLPDLDGLNALRVAMLRWSGVVIGKDARISGEAVFYGDGGEIELGDRVTIRPGVRLVVETGGKIKIGTYVLLGENTFLESRWVESGKNACLELGDDIVFKMGSLASANGSAHVKICDHTRIAHMVSIKANHHQINPAADCIGDESITDDITIGEGTWICAGVLVLPGAKIGKKNVLAAGAVVKGETPDYALMAGCPAVVKKRYLFDIISA